MSGVQDLNYSIKLAGDTLRDPQNISYRRNRSDQHIVQIRIASPDYVTASTKRNIAALFDLDVFTPDDWEKDKKKSVKDWIVAAHDYEKEEFFKLFTDKMKNQLIEN